LRSLRDAFKRFTTEAQTSVYKCKQTYLPTFPPNRSYDSHRAVYELEAVRLWDAWARFVRQAIVISATGTGETLTGLPLSPSIGIKTPHDVIPKLRSLYPKNKAPWWEPSWGRPTEGIEAARLLRVSNFSTLSAALGATPSPIDQLRLTRNFMRTAIKERYSKLV
jgi:hypothetical protein